MGSEMCIRDSYGIRDDRIFVGDAWATGLMRRAILAAGKRLVEQGDLHQAEQLLDARLSEMIDLLNGDKQLKSLIADRYQKRTARKISDAPLWLGAKPPAPPPVDWLPRRAQRVARAMDGYMKNLFEPAALLAGVENGDQLQPEPPSSDEQPGVLRGAAAGAGVYQGPARIVRSADDLAKVIAGDVVIAVSTSPAFNVILPLAAALVTDRGGLLSHAAIVAREYGIPAVVGARGATDRFSDGELVQVNGDRGEIGPVEAA